MQQTTIDVTGMACGGCEQTVQDAVSALEGISSVTASHESGRVRVEHDDAIDEAAIGDAIENAGYEVA